MTILVEFEDHAFPITYDVIELYRKKIVFNKVREGVHSPNENSLSLTIEEGWSTFAFNVDKFYGLKNVNSYAELLLNASVEFKPELLKIEGSNVTVNCHFDLRTWKISKKPTVLPLENSKQYWFSFYSSQNFLTTIQLEMRNYQLRWDRGALTTIPTIGQSLPPFMEHHLTLNCYRNGIVICTLMVGMGRKLVEEIRIGEFPKSVAIFGKDASFFVLLHGRDPLLSQEIGIDGRRISTTNPIGAVNWIILSVLILLTCSCTALFIRISSLRKKADSKNTDIENSGRNGYISSGIGELSNDSPSLAFQQLLKNSGIRANNRLLDVIK